MGTEHRIPRSAGHVANCRFIQGKSQYGICYTVAFRTQRVGAAELVRVRNWHRSGIVMKDTLGVLLAGGAGERLYPLTRDRAKPAVTFGGIYREVNLRVVPQSFIENVFAKPVNVIDAAARKCVVRTYVTDATGPVDVAAELRDGNRIIQKVAKSFEAVQDGAVDCGITLLDMAPAYGNGEAESVVGAAFDGRLPAGI